MRTIDSILIANRGEIASRIIRTCRKLGIRSIALFSDADRNLPYVNEADQAVHLPGNTPAETYLVQDLILQAARDTQAMAIHPGYGFLAENADFARAVAKAGLIFIGPNPDAIEAMGSKSEAKKLMAAHEVPVIPGYQGKEQDVASLKKAALDVGFPLLLKAVAGGGGKGMRRVDTEPELVGAIEAAKREALSAFGNDELIIERYFDSARHIEFQILGDQHGNAVHLLERECSLQRRYQKVVEESPSPVLSVAKREEMGSAAVRAAKALNYDNAGTVEFIYTDQNEFYFLEVNTRLQVEHPVTEMITGLDLVELQIEMAEGRPLPLEQAEIKAHGYAVEVRLYAEDPNNDFLPATGKVVQWAPPSDPQIRIETGITTGSEISIFYDPMIAKLVAWGKDRAKAHRKMQYFLRNLVCLGLTTNQQFLIQLFQNEDFATGNYHTHFIQDRFDELQASQLNEASLHFLLGAATLLRTPAREKERTVLTQLPSGWRNNFYAFQHETFLMDEVSHKVEYRAHQDEWELRIGEVKYTAQLVGWDLSKARINWNGTVYTVHFALQQNKVMLHHAPSGSFELQVEPRFPEKNSEQEKGGYIAPMPSQVVKVLVEPGQRVESGMALVVLSSMKMENTIEADEAGTVEEIFVEDGQNIEAGTVLLSIHENESKE